MNLKYKKLSNTIPNLQYAKAGDAGFDLYAKEDTVLMPGKYAGIATGVALEIEEGYVGLIWDKSGLAIKNGLKTLGGVVDAGYRGEIVVGMINLSDTPYTFEAGHKVAQMIIQKFETASFELVENLSETERGDTGFGSSGK
ncbi:MAG TPA: dUTP diphosphatase [Candidatus Paceibacterota bacterium]|nr:dUTP diphosphatase [Candidatus Paceibacterota bacterium]